MYTLWHDIRHGAKLLAKNPGFTAAAIFSLALGIGLNSTIFCLVDSLILRPLPVDRPEELVFVRLKTEKGLQSSSLPYPDYMELKNQSSGLSGLIGTQHKGAMLSVGEASELISAEVVTGNYFTVLGVRPYLGRMFQEGDRDLAAPIAVISYGLWQRRFGGDRAIVGKAVELTKRQVTVIGIVSRGFGGARRPFTNTEVWYPAESVGATAAGPRAEDFELLGRLAAGVPIQRAQAEIDTIARRMAPSNPFADKIVGASLAYETKEYLSSFGKLGLFVMLITGLVLLIACVNVSNLLLARSQARRKEIAIRLALGGKRTRLMRQLLTESLVLSLAATAVGLVLTIWAIRALPAFLPALPMRLIPDVRPDAQVFGFAIGLALVTTLIFALVPALHASKLSLVPLLNESAGSGQGGRRYIGRNALVVGQLALSIVLLTQSGLLVKSLVRGLQSDVGFEKKNMLVAQFALGIYAYDDSQAKVFYDTLTERLRALPGVKQVTLTRRVPLSLFGGGVAQQVAIPGEKTLQMIKYNSVGLGYFRTIGTPILKGRDFSPQDFVPPAKVALVNQTFAQRFWPGQDPTGQIIRIGDPSKPDSVTVIGIAKDGPINRIGETPEPYMYLPRVAGFAGELTLLVETSGNPKTLAGPLLSIVRGIDRNVAPFILSTLKDVIRQGLFDREMLADFMGCFGLLGLILASFGLYGIISYTVSQRTREIGLRMAIGACRGDALRMVLRKGLTLAVIGTAAGLPIAVMVSYLLQSAFYEVSPADPTAVGGTALLLIGVALLASYIPARRATRVDPMIALRDQ